ncbi:protein argonaute-4 [Tetranychus urticae]|uniref:Piwi domain-containing protein n=1 Tax=Tetranychus urticae TaxID=32264 RepID=T1KDJ4_TETUR|nr:protein argonaute-4 [Tetranychus urticae]
MSSRGGGGYYRGDGPRGGGGYSRGGGGNPRGGSGGYSRGGGSGSARGGGSGYARGGGGEYVRGGQSRGRGDGYGRGRGRGGYGESRDIVDPKLISSDNIQWNYTASALNTIKPEFVPRKGHLSTNFARRIQLMTNHFAFKFSSDISIYHYDFSWLYHGSDPESKEKPTEKKLNRADCYRLFDAVLSHHSQFFQNPSSVGYDGSKNVYTPYKLKCTGSRLGVADVQLEDRRGTFSVAFKLANTIPLSSLDEYYAGRSSNFPKETIQALEVILKFPSRSDMISLGRYAMFPVDGDRQLLSSWMELALGHRKSLRLSEIGLTLVVDRAATAFRKSGSAIDFLNWVLNSDPRRQVDLSNFRPGTHQIEAIRRAFLCVKVVTDHLGFNRNYKIKGVTYNAANVETFHWKEGEVDETVSVAEYFQRKYGKTLRYPNLPCLRAGKCAMIPIELCEIVANQTPSSILTRLSPDEQAEMIKLTATPPNARFTCLLQAHEQIRQTINDTLEQFGLNIDIKPIGVTGFVLAAPKLIFDQNKMVTPRDGKWDLRECTFYKNKKFSKFGVLNFCASPEDGINFCKMFVTKACEMKMMAAPSQPVIKNWPPELRNEQEKVKSAAIAAMLKEMKDQGCAFALCFFPSDKSIYNLTKRVADVKLCFPTQGVASKNVRKCSPQLIANILAKVNKKLGGVNVILKQDDKPPLLKKKIMIIGADVTHPGEADELHSSVAASVSTYDKDHTMFYPSVRVQPKKNAVQSVTETIEDFQAMIQEHLQNFKESNGSLPSTILYLRDGVSEGQYSQIVTKEVNHLLRPYGQSDPYKPAVTAVIISKRIQTRTRPVNPNEGVGKHGNVPPGTTIDSIITHPSDFDYFQYGHEGIQGTSRPCHYYLVHDDNNLSTEEMSQVSFHLCHLFERCTRSTSAPAPVMHAHNLAYRARQWIVGGGEKQDLRGKSREERIRDETNIATRLNDLVKSIDTKFRKQSMFFV